MRIKRWTNLYPKVSKGALLLGFLTLISCGGEEPLPEPPADNNNDIVEPVCGNGLLEDGEACDDGNDINDDNCSNECISSFCGDGIIQQNEACDDGNDIEDDGCTNVCSLPTCGDGIVQIDQSEECDDGNFNDKDDCTNLCKINTCGDGILQEGEECDDGNLNNNDDCTNTCEVNFYAFINKLVPAENSHSDEFGSSIDIDDNVIIVGAAFDNVIDMGVDRGAAYIFEQSGVLWEKKHKLSPNIGQDYENFGSSVGISGSTVVAGAPSHIEIDQETGAAYIYEKNGDNWEEKLKLVPNTLKDGDAFGSSVAIDNDIIVIGAPLVDGNGIDSGAVYVYEKNGDNWEQSAILKPDNLDADKYDYYGRVVAISNGTILVGCHNDDHQGNTDSGAAYVYEKVGNAWTQKQKLIANDVDAYVYFGEAIAIHGDSLVVGAYTDVDYGDKRGTVYLFERKNNTWQQSKKFSPEGLKPFDTFGNSLALNEDTLVVGALLDDEKSQDSGAAYLYHKENGDWTLKRKVTAFDAFFNDQFGSAVAIGNEVIAIAAHWDDNQDNDYNNGSVYIFTP
ncbi:MAG: DUF4215 domain-containing protein [Deltaproteobacteria bacterium]|nr:DUF4215 domain-containing protein [Deltaproteobacteria bacterium]